MMKIEIYMGLILLKVFQNQIRLIFWEGTWGHYSTSYKYTREFLDNFLEDQKDQLVKGYVENTLPGLRKIAFYI